MSWAVFGFALQAVLWKHKMAKKESMSEDSRKLQDQHGVVGDEKHDFVYVSSLVSAASIRLKLRVGFLVSTVAGCTTKKLEKSLFRPPPKPS